MKTQGWENRLIVYLERCARQPFQPGVLDCALFVAGAIQEMTDVDHVPVKAYRSLAEGRKRLKTKGFSDHIELVASILIELPTVLMAQRGDVVVMPEDALGIVQGEMVYVMGLDGLGLRPLSDATRVFRV